MLFNSLSFLLFFSTVLLLYYFLPSRYRWILLLISSLFFYMCWKWEYIFLIFIPATIDFFVAKKIEQSEDKKHRKLLLVISIVTNLGLLFYFKYYNFFIDSFNATSSFFSAPFFIDAVRILLPVGISFYTFQSISYTVEVYRRNIVAEKSFGRFALFVSYFPQLVAGPINRPQVLLPQLREFKQLNYTNMVEGSRLILWGLFKKVVIADRLSFFANIVFNNPESYHGMSVMIAVVFFSFQIYCDFSGYSDIAIGVAKMMGVDLVRNFNKPYYSHSIKEFWAKWHISLSTWFRDYLYIPMGGNKVSVPRWLLNLFITFLISGIWHGASWNFVIWGAIHGIFIVLEALNSKYSIIKLQVPSFLKMIFTFSIVCFAWIFFRANTIHDSFTVINNLFNFQHSFLAEIKQLNGSDTYNLALGIPLIFLLIVFERGSEIKLLQDRFYSNTGFRYLCYIILIVLIAFFGVFVDQSSFIYFQF